MIRSLAVVLALLLWTDLAEAGKSPPPPTTSQFLMTKSAEFMIIDTVGVWYSMTCSLRAAVGIPLHATVKFEDPSNRKAPLIVNRTIEAGQLELKAESPAFRRIRNAAIYRVEVLLFKDDARKELLGEHVQKIYFEIPAQLGQVLGIEFL